MHGNHNVRPTSAIDTEVFTVSLTVKISAMQIKQKLRVIMQ